MSKSLKVLMITSEYPSPDKPYHVPFIARQVKFLKKAGIDVELMVFRGAKNPVNYLLTYFRVQKILSNSTYDLVHAQFGQSGIFTLFNTIPQVVTFRGNDLEGIIGSSGSYTLKGKVLQKVSRLVARKSDAIILVSERMARSLPENLDYSVIPSGLDMQKFQPMDKLKCRSILKWDLHNKIVLFGGRSQVVRKRFKLAQEAVQLLAPPVTMIPLENVDHEMMPVLMNAADILLLTSKHEGSPNVVKEALACNTPVVSVDVGDVRSRIANVAGCYLCETDTPHEIAAGINKVLKCTKAFDGRTHVMALEESVLTKKVIDIYRAIYRTSKKR